MLIEIAELARRPHIPADVRRELEAILARHGTAQATSADAGAATTAFPHTLSLVPGTEGGEAPSDPRTVPASVAGRYEDLGPLGEGGMGAVRRVRDAQLNRTLALKTVHRHVVASQTHMARFREEAQVTAQLQHPNIIPIHDLGRLPDGRLWYTMREVRGRTLHDLLGEVHGGPSTTWEAHPSGWTLRRLMMAFLSVCNGVAFAHEQGVVHRDLKPDNIMIGDHGEVYVLDWGLAKLVGRPESAASSPDGVRTDRSDSQEHLTQVGQVTGTPAYMPPEQARGEIDEIDARSDVYALGAILYELLAGTPPYVGRPLQIVRQVVEGPPPLVVVAARGTGAPVVPVALVDACHRAMSREPADRYATASALAEAIQAWLDGTRRREHALQVVETALAGAGRAHTMLQRAQQLQLHGDSLLEGIETWRPETDKAAGWALQDEATDLRLAAELEELEVEQGLQGALRIDPTLVEAHAALADRYRADHAAAEAARDADGRARSERLVRAHAEALPESHGTRTACATYLRGDGALTLVTDPPGASVELYRYQTRDRRLVEVFERSLGTTPLVEVPLPMGSYLCVVTHPACDEVRYPVAVSRLGHWHGVAPGDREPTGVWLPPRGGLGADEVYVPAGWFSAGGDPQARQGLAQQHLWADALVMQRFPVTNRQFIAFLDELVERGQEAEALRLVPRERQGKLGEVGSMIYGREASGGFCLVPDADGDLWLEDWPVMMVDCDGARAYASWLAARTGLSWRLPGELEWEKAARGVDGRIYPWGDHFDASRCLMTNSHCGERLPAPVESYPIDVSPYGVRGMAGNVADWCADAFRTDGPLVPDQRLLEQPDASPVDALRVLRGGSWGAYAQGSSTAQRARNRAWAREATNGFRLIRGVTPPVV